MKKTTKLLFNALLSVVFGLSYSAQAQTLFKDLDPTTNVSSNPEEFLTIAGKMYFVTTGGGTYVHRIWVSDGTATNTTILKDSVITTSVGGVIDLLDVNGTLFWVLYKNGSSTSATSSEIWKSDGTVAGTVLVKALTSQPVPGGSAPRNFAAAGNKLFFQMGTSVSGAELWVSDGTAAGTMEVIDLWSGSTSGYPNPGVSDMPMMGYNGKVYFSGTTGNYNTELFTSDGTSAGTTLVQEIRSGNASSNPGYFVVYNNFLYFMAADGTNGNGNGLWKTDGNTTTKVFSNTADNKQPMVFQNKLFFINGVALWKCDSAANATLVMDSAASTILGGNSTTLVMQYARYKPVAPYFDYFYYSSDGTVAGTIPVSYNVAKSASFTVLNEKMYLVRLDSGSVSALGLWESDGTEAGTSKLFAGQYMGPVYPYNNALFFSNFGTGIGYELYTYVPTGSSGIAPIETESNIALYPNPSAGIFTLLTETTSDRTIEVYNMTGAKVFQCINSNQVDLSTYPQGVYFVRVYEEGKTFTGRIVVR